MRLKQPTFRRIFAAAAFLAWAGWTAWAQPWAQGPAPRPRIITMDEVIRLALTNDLDILISQQTPLLDRLALDGLSSAYDPVFSMVAQRRFNSQPAGIDPITGLLESQKSSITSYAPSLKGTLPTGTQYELNLDVEHDLIAGLPHDAQYSGSAGASLTQPLLKNLWIDSPRWNIALARNTLKYDQLALRLQIIATINAVKAAYYNLIYARENVEVEVAAVKLAGQLVSENKKKVELGSLAPLDEKQAESQAATTAADLLSAQQTLAVQENTLKSLMALNLSEWNGVTPVPAEQLVAVPEYPNVIECWQTALAMRPDVAQAKVNLEKQHVTLKYDYNQLFPELDLEGTYGHNGFGSSVDKDLGAIQRGGFKSYTYGVVLNVPLANTGARANYKSAKVTLQQLLLQLKKVENAVIVAVQNDVTIVQSDLLRIDATRKARAYAEDALTAEQTRLEHGKSTSFVVLQLQNNLTTARSAEIRALADYNIALEQLAYDEGITLERNSIRMNLP
ncbi:MAG TPA: TolC family protein [Verrucomicrobiae bacterium]|jgi:outer membrane protein TolC|nr:TolC family protein [Verrucomicrobiae bacterium]